jgi:cell division protease FtsH
MMVTSMGFSKKLGQVAWSSGSGPSFLGQQMGQAADCSGFTADVIDTEVGDCLVPCPPSRPAC